MLNMVNKPIISFLVYLVSTVTLTYLLHHELSLNPSVPAMEAEQKFDEDSIREMQPISLEKLIEKIFVTADPLTRQQLLETLTTKTEPLSDPIVGAPITRSRVESVMLFVLISGVSLILFTFFLSYPT